MWAIAINPTSGQGRGERLGRDVIAFFNLRRLPFTVIAGGSADELSAELSQFLDDQRCKGVISVGGDGLAHLVLQLVVPRHIPFAIVPAGTGNDFVRTLGWSLNDISRFLDNVVTTEPQPIDLGNVDSEWFGAILSTGFDSIVNERANQLSWPKGPQRYNAAIALELPKFQPRQYEIEYDEGTLSVEAMLIAIGNGRSYGGGMLVCPQANTRDGLFDVMVLKPVSKFEFLKVFPKVYSGSHIHHPQVITFRTRKISISAPAIAYADGERIGPLPIKAECIPQAGLTWSL